MPKKNTNFIKIIETDSDTGEIIQEMIISKLNIIAIRFDGDNLIKIYFSGSSIKIDVDYQGHTTIDEIKSNLDEISVIKCYSFIYLNDIMKYGRFTSSGELIRR